MLRITLFLFFFCFSLPCYAEEKHPVDVCYMVADLKYNAKQGVKICEIQQASLSLFNGDTFRHIEEESIHQALFNCLERYNKKGWVVSNGLADKQLVSTLASSVNWKNPKDLIALFSDSNFMNQAKQPVKNIDDLASYQGFLYVNWSQFSAITDYEKRFPGLVIIDKSSFPFWIDKYLMTKLFREDGRLAILKPKWGHYKKNYTKELAKKIEEDLQCDIFVIKPRGEFLGKGVIIVEKKDLDEVLNYIITKKGKLSESQDPGYSSWKNDSFDSFMVEEFVTSEPIPLPHLDNKMYQPTMRVAFLLVYHNGSHKVHFLGGYWKTPSLSIDDEGDFMQKNKDVCKPPYYAAVEEKTMLAVQKELSLALPVLHSKMLQFCMHSEEEYISPSKRAQVKIVLSEKK